MMATVGSPSGSSLVPLLESLEDSVTSHSEQTDVYLTIANRLSGEGGRQFLPAVVKHFSRLGKAILIHMTDSNAELSQAALQALGFCVYHEHVVSGIHENLAAEILSALCSLVVTSTDKNSCTRALWVISKQSFPSVVVAKKVGLILDMLDSVWSREDIQSVIMEHEALNVVIRMLEQAPDAMSNCGVRWAKLVIPLVVHSASKVRLRAAAAMELGLPLLLEKQTEVAAIIEPILASKLVPELQKLFTTKNEVNVLKLWPLFVRLLGKQLHRGGPFINSLLHLEELGFRSSSPSIKKIAFIAWKSLIDNFALNPEILCSAKRMKLLLQPLLSIHVRTEPLQLSKLEVWWYLVVRLGPNLGSHFEQVSIPLLQSAIGGDAPTVPCTPTRGAGQNGIIAQSTPKTSLNSTSNTPRMNLNSSLQGNQSYPSIQLLGLEMLLHYFLGPEVVAMAAKSKLTLTLEPLTHPFLSGTSSFSKHAAVLISYVKDAFLTIGSDAPDSLLLLIWKSLVYLVSSTIESGGSKKDRHGSEVLTLMLQALQVIISSDTLPASRVLVLFEITVKGIHPRVLGSTSYQVGNMDVLNGTPALFLILLVFNSNMLSSYAEDERFFQCLSTLVGCGLSGPTSSLAFGEAVLGAMACNAGSVANKEHLWRMWSAVVILLTHTITQSNEVNQGDALEHNFSAVHCALMFPVSHLLAGSPLSQATQKSLLATWSKLYKVFARCSALVATAEENVCCEELCAKMAAALNTETLAVSSTLEAVSSILQVMVEVVDFSPYTPQFQQKPKSPHTPLNWARKRSGALGNLASFQALLVQSLQAFLSFEAPEAAAEAACEATGLALVSVLSTVFTNLALVTPVQEALASLTHLLTLFYKQAASEPPRFSSQLVTKLEKLLADVLGCLQSRATLTYDGPLLAGLSPLLCVLFPHKNKALRTLVTQFWNGTFAKALSLTYPDELKPILSQVKQRTPIILPGFEAVVVSNELSGQYSSECSQLETKLSGVEVSSVGKRGSLLGRATELKDRNSKSTSKPVSTKLDFGSPKPPRREVLEEEASIDFVFIPPENKERILTEHQKEVKRTKRDDIPAMYNNLDASLDNTVFSQYTQSQDNSTEKLSTEQADSAVKQSPSKDETDEADILSKDTQDYRDQAAPENKVNDPTDVEQEEVVPKAADESMEDAHEDVAAEDLEPKEGTSADVSGSSDLVSGTPQKPSSRRQSFITLEKYADGKPASPIQVTKFTGPLARTSDGQELSTAATTHSSTGDKQEPLRPCVPAESQSPRRRDSSETERSPSGGTGNVIPDTQTTIQDEGKSVHVPRIKEIDGTSQEEESDGVLEDSQSSQSTSEERRRSVRQRVRPRLPGQVPEEWDQEYSRRRKKHSTEEEEEEEKMSSPEASQTDNKAQGRWSRRGTQALEADHIGVRTRGGKDKPQVGRPRKIRLYNQSKDLLGTDEEKPLRRSSRGGEVSQTDSQMDTQSDTDTQSQGKPSARRKSGAEETGGSKHKGRGSTVEKQEPKPTDSKKEATNSQIENKSQEMLGSKTVILSNSEEFELGATPGTDETEPSQSEPESVTPSSQANSQSQGRRGRKRKLVSSSLEPQADEPKSEAGTEDSLNQESSQTLTPSASESPLQGRLRRRSKASPYTLESTDSAQSEHKAESQATPIGGGAESGPRTRTRRAKAEEELSQTSSSSPLDASGSVAVKPSEGRGRYSRQRSSQALQATMESSESDSPGNRDSPVPKKRGRKPKGAYAPSPLALTVQDATKNDSPQKGSSHGTPTTSPLKIRTSSDPVQLLKEVEIPVTRAPLVVQNIEHQGAAVKEEARMNVDVGTIIDLEPFPEKTGTENTKPIVFNRDLKCKQFCISPYEKKLPQTKLDMDCTSSQETNVEDSESIEAKATNTQSQGSLLTPEPPLPTDHGSCVLNNGSIENVSSTQVDSGSPSCTLTSSDIKLHFVREHCYASPRITTEKFSESSEDKVLTGAQLAGVADKEPLVDTDLSLVSSVEPADGKDVIVTPTIRDDGECQSALDDHLVEKEVGQITSIKDQTTSHEEEMSMQEEDVVAAAAVPPPQEEEDVVAAIPPPQEEEDVVAAIPPPQAEEDVVAAAAVPPPQEEEDVVAAAAVPPPQQEEDVVAAAAVPPPQQEEDVVAAAAVPPPQQEEDVVAAAAVPPPQEEEDVVAAVPPPREEEDVVAAVPPPQAEEDVVAAVPPPQEEEEKGPSPCIEFKEDTQMDTAVASDNLLAGDHNAMEPSEAVDKEEYQASPAKRKCSEGLIGPDVTQSPSDSRMRGTWSPSASPSTSILKKGMKKTLEEETISPLVKSRRVSFANPIHHQELADDIDRRSPVIRTSSPKRAKINSTIPQPKYVTTPTKGLLVLSPRNLHHSGYKSSKKCLISEMSQEPRAIPKDCVYPALVGCSTPVEAVLPQIASNVWTRGFGQLVRARKIKTVGDLSSLTPSDIKALPIRSPKISNVKKALKLYEQQRKGRGADDLKSFEEMEQLINSSEPEETTSLTQEEEDRTPNEPLATALADEPTLVDQPSTEQTPGAPAAPGGLLSEVEALTSTLRGVQLNLCSPDELVQMHDILGCAMRSVMLELQSRLCGLDDKH